MSSPIPDPGAVPDGPNFTDLPPSNDDPAPGEAVPPPPPADDPEPTEDH